MALIKCDFFSNVLGLSTTMSVILPQNTTKQGYPTLFLLHGISDDDSMWLRRTSIERYVSNMGLAVVMPQVHRSFYTDMVHGLNYWTFISEELPAIARSFFPLSDKREDNFVAGLSMGGYGAFKLALRHPDKFAAAASLSGALDMANRNHQERFPKDYPLIYGDRDIMRTEDDLLFLVERMNHSDITKPLLYQCCGTEDFLYEDNQVFLSTCRSTDFKLTYNEGPGVHNWDYWDAKIQDVLKWLPIKTEGKLPKNS